MKKEELVYKMEKNVMQAQINRKKSKVERLFDTQKVGKKLQTVFIVILTLFFFNSCILTFNMVSLGSKMTSIYQQGYQNITYQMESERELQNISFYLLLAEEEGTDLGWCIDNIRECIRNQQEKLELIKNNMGKAAYEGVQETEEVLDSFWKKTERICSSMETGNVDVIAQYRQYYIENISEVQNVLTRLQEEISKVVGTGYINSMQVQAITLLMVVCMFCVVLAACVRLGKKLTVSIVEPVQQLEGLAENIAGGKLQTQIECDSKDEIGMLAASLHRTEEKLLKVITDMNHMLQGFAEGNFTKQTECKEVYTGDFEPLLENIEKQREK